MVYLRALIYKKRSMASHYKVVHFNASAFTKIFSIYKGFHKATHSISLFYLAIAGHNNLYKDVIYYASEIKDTLNYKLTAFTKEL